MDPNIDVQVAFNRFYDIVLGLLDEHYPLAKITVTSRDPPYITPAIKSMLRSKNKLLKKGRLEQAEALTTRIGVAITKACEGRLVGLNSNSKNGSKLMWEKVREITGKRRQTPVNGVDPVSLNVHYATTSTYLQYCVPVPRHTCCPLPSWPSAANGIP